MESLICDRLEEIYNCIKEVEKDEIFDCYYYVYIVINEEKTLIVPYKWNNLKTFDYNFYQLTNKIDKEICSIFKKLVYN